MRPKLLLNSMYGLRCYTVTIYVGLNCLND